MRHGVTPLLVLPMLVTCPPECGFPPVFLPIKNFSGAGHLVQLGVRKKFRGVFHLCTIRDFVTLCREAGITIERTLVLNARGTPVALRTLGLANLFGEQAMFVLCRRR